MRLGFQEPETDDAQRLGIQFEIFVARKAGLTEAEADEVAQESLIGVAKKIGEFQHAGNRGSFRAFGHSPIGGDIVGIHALADTEMKNKVESPASNIEQKTNRDRIRSTFPDLPDRGKVAHGRQRNETKPSARFEDFMNTPQVIDQLLEDDGMIPNNSKLPLLIYPGAVKLSGDDPAAILEALFASNRWSGSWRDGIYKFHHYHSAAHEVLGAFSGSATVQFGGACGITQSVSAGDVVIIPAGVGHKNLRCSSDFGVVGAYPPGQRVDMCYGKPGERPQADANIARVPLPRTDPVFGSDGPLLVHWFK